MVERTGFPVPFVKICGTSNNWIPPINDVMITYTRIGRRSGNVILKNTCVDVRFSYVTRGSAPYVEWLGIQENPNGGGWAASKNYGNDLLGLINKLKAI